MLVLSRRLSESIVLNQEITVTIVDIRGDKVRLGIQAPPDATVHRAEAMSFSEPSFEDPFRTVVQSPASTSTVASGRGGGALRIDRDRPLESLKEHLSAVLGRSSYEQILPLLNQLTESKGIAVRSPTP